MKRRGWTLLLPGLIWVTAFTIIPLLTLVFLSLTNSQAFDSTTYVGIENYTRLFSSSDSFFPALGNTIMFSLTSTALTLVTGVFVGWLFSRRLPGIRVMRSLVTTPLFVGPAAVAAIGYLIFAPRGGLLTSVSSLVGADVVPWLADSSLAPVAIVLLDAWQWMTLVFIVVLLAIQAIPGEAYENAHLDTRSEWAIFRYIVFPRLRPVLITIGLLRLLEGLRMLDIPFLLTKGGPGYATQTLSLQIYARTFDNLLFGHGAAIGVVLLALVTPIALLLMWRLRRRFAFTDHSDRG